MLDTLSAPYPFEFERRKTWGFTVGTALFVALFLLVFQPFGTRAFQSDTKTWFLLGYAPVIALSVGAFFEASRALFPSLLQEEGWTVGRQIIWIGLLTGTGILAAHIYFLLYFERPFQWYNLAYFTGLSLSISVFPISITVLLSYTAKLKHYQAGAASITMKKGVEERAEQQRIVLTGEYSEDSLALNTAQLRYLQSADNYVLVCYVEGGAVQQKMIRATLKSMEAQLEGVPEMARCHRSYLVNLSEVRRVSGNAQGYKLSLEGIEETIIPVARSKGKAILQMLQAQS